MTDHFHAIVWIDHRETKVFHFNATDVDKVVIPSHATQHHIHHKANATGSGHVGVDKEFLKRVTAALTHTGAILLTGPANAKIELKNYLTEHSPDLAKRISGVESLDHPTDGVLIGLARKFFKADDRMR
jgi:stalled ribosome rescue protein Dom34